MAVFLVFFAAYFLLRGLPEERVALSTANAQGIIDLERALGIFREAGWQQAVIDNDRLIDLANFTYRYLHLPMLLIVGYFFFTADMRKYRVMRNTILLSGAVGLFFYWLVPVTPPRLLADAGVDYGFVDTLVGERRPRPGSLSNDYAAIPSYHFGWIFLMTIGVWWCWKSAILRGAAVAFAGLMWWSIVVTGNHYFLDMVLGAIVVVLTMRLSLAWERWVHTRDGQRLRWTPHLGGHRLPF